MTGPLPSPPSHELEALLRHRVEAGEVSAAAALIGTAEEVIARAAAGSARREPPVAADVGTRFDLASLAKPVTATLALLLDAAGVLPLDLPVGEALAGSDPRLARRPLEALLRHRAGLRPWAPLPLLLASEPGSAAERRARCADLLAAGELLGAPAETYSDLGFLLWGLVAERVLGQPLERVLEDRLGEAFGLAGPVPPPGDGPGVAECLLDNRREVELAAAGGWKLAPAPPPPPGTVQDGNARHLGGYPGHAGLFGGAEELWQVARRWLDPEPPLDPRAVERALHGGRRFVLGWGRRRVRGSAGAALSAAAYGWIGFTGGSLWVDPERDLVVVLLAHRTSPEVDLVPWRREVHRRAVGWREG